jgi:hypothetical protein
MKKSHFQNAALNEFFPNYETMKQEMFLSADTYNGVLQVEYNKQFLTDPIDFYSQLENLPDNIIIYTWLSFDDEKLYKKIVKEYGINNTYNY